MQIVQIGIETIIITTTTIITIIIKVSFKCLSLKVLSALPLYDIIMHWASKFLEKTSPYLQSNQGIIFSLFWMCFHLGISFPEYDGNSASLIPMRLMTRSDTKIKFGSLQRQLIRSYDRVIKWTGPLKPCLSYLHTSESLLKDHPSFEPTFAQFLVVAFSTHTRILGECLTIHSPPAFFFFF